MSPPAAVPTSNLERLPRGFSHELLQGRGSGHPLRRRDRGGPRELRGEARRGLHDHRPERRRQDHHLQPDRPDLSGDFRADLFPADRTSAACRRTAWRSWASRALSRTSSCSSTPPCCRTCSSAATGIARPALWQELLFTPAARRAELAAREAVEKVIDFLDLAQVPRQPGRRPALRRAQGGGARARARHRAEAAAARRAVLGPQSRGDRRHGVLDRGHPAATSASRC